ncbi:dienelactone hydrolase family protein [Streptantibioticus ferralitis]|uniref:Dienelactone hydrolase family protein n=1 Tax=Streptantibioticus ferralitis TaxID=236510 RepID=A0ABT5YWG5_9ACTN|nr:dienelactone hydrolase family protein [Streptantibioticus ferralitis]MDF2255938.1 dienelactone hydrolase family protein [Streptantibioticus ferralitis]
MSLDEWHRIGDQLKAARVAHEQVTYPDAGHGFFNEQRQEAYDAEAAEDSWQRTLAVLERYVSRRTPA